MATTTILTRNDDDGEYSGQDLLPILPPPGDPDHTVTVRDGDAPGQFQVDFEDDSIRYDVDTVKDGGAA